MRYLLDALVLTILKPLSVLVIKVPLRINFEASVTNTVVFEKVLDILKSTKNLTDI